jgi:hypothetical protein
MNESRPKIPKRILDKDLGRFTDVEEAAGRWRGRAAGGRDVFSDCVDSRRTGSGGEQPL